MGYSLSLHNAEDYGTFGEWLELQQPDSEEWEQLGITCSHCIFSRKYEGFSLEDLFNNPRSRTKRDSCEKCFGSKNTAHRLSSTLLCGRQDRGSRGNCSLGNRKVRVLPGCRPSQGLSCGEFVLPYDERDWKLDTELLNITKRQKTELEGYRESEDYSFGTIYAASGLRKKQSLRTRARRFNLGTQLKATHLVHKVGRKTNLTEGKYRCLETVELKNDATGDSETTWEHAIDMIPGEASFTYPGDSGVIVFDRSEQMIGLCHSGHLGGSHVEDLIAAIKEVTGACYIPLVQDEPPAPP
ncbi:hypothetical protein BBP40_010348 [Aspergillus hancockii]|nr:hypothetical protein BBP40_010348 [Aspergillus hancockii]